MRVFLVSLVVVCTLPFVVRSTSEVCSVSEQVLPTLFANVGGSADAALHVDNGPISGVSAAVAVDGDLKTVWQSHPDVGDPNPYLRVTLTEPTVLCGIAVYARPDCCTHEFTKLIISTFDANDNVIQQYEDVHEASESVLCPSSSGVVQLCHTNSAPVKTVEIRKQGAVLEIADISLIAGGVAVNECSQVDHVCLTPTLELSNSVSTTIAESSTFTQAETATLSSALIATVTTTADATATIQEVCPFSDRLPQTLFAAAGGSAEVAFRIEHGPLGFPAASFAAIDGDLKTVWQSHPDVGDPNPYLRVTLTEPTVLCGIAVYARPDCCTHEFTKLIISTFDANDNVIQQYEDVHEASESVLCPSFSRVVQLCHADSTPVKSVEIRKQGVALEIADISLIAGRVVVDECVTVARLCPTPTQPQTGSKTVSTTQIQSASTSKTGHTQSTSETQRPGAPSSTLSITSTTNTTATVAARAASSPEGPQPPPPPFVTPFCTGACMWGRCEGGALRTASNGYVTLLIRGSTGGSVWGSTIFSSDSSVAAAAVLFGAVDDGEEKTVRVRCIGLAPAFTGATRNGVVSQPWQGSYHAFEFVTEPEPEPIVCTHRHCALATCVTRGQQFNLVVTGLLAGEAVYGTGVYTADSDIRVAAVHAGVLQPGQTATLNVLCSGAHDAFAGSTQHGVTSIPWGFWQVSWAIRVAPS